MNTVYTITAPQSKNIACAFSDCIKVFPFTLEESRRNYQTINALRAMLISTKGSIMIKNFVHTTFPMRFELT